MIRSQAAMHASLLSVVFLLSWPLHAQEPADAEVTMRKVVPSTVDPTLKTEFDAPNVIFLPTAAPRPELVVWLPGTNGKPGGDSMILKVLASSGFRTVGLMYNDSPTGESLCSKQDNAACGGDFREERLKGDAPASPGQNTVQESIDRRLVSLLKYEQQQNPKEGWDAFLSGDEPNWPKIIISGHSQGAGHAAYIAKLYPVARVVLFSGGPSGYADGGTMKISDWVKLPGKTPADRWWAEFHEKEKTAPVMPVALAALGVPKDHILVFNLDVPPTVKAPGLVAFHMTVLHDPRYLPLWKKMYGIE